jgi:hypothetical protein
MALEGSYQWWRENYSSNDEFQRVCGVLAQYGIDCSAVEVDHFPPNAAYTGTPYAQRLAIPARPSLPLPKYLHRYFAGGGGMGGHASTTGSTFVSKVWTPQLRARMTGGDFHGAMKQDIIDKKNLALHATDGQDRKLFDKLMLPAVHMVHSLGMIDEAQYYDLLNDLGFWS